MSIFSLLAARSVSIFETPACANRFFSVCAQLEILVQQLRVVAVRVPARPPGLVEPEPESERMNLLTHGYSFAFFVACAGFGRLRRLLRARGAAAALAARRRPPPTGTTFSGRSATAHREVRRPLQHAERAAHRRRPHALLRRPLVGVARRHEQPIDVAAEPVLLLRVGDRRPQHLRDVARHRLARELQRRERAVDVLAADQVEHEPGLLGRGADVARGRLRLNHDASSPPPASPPPPAPAAAPAPGAPARRPPPPSRPPSSCGP